MSYKAIKEAYHQMLIESTEHPMIEVDGVMKHRHNSLGQPIHHTDEGIKNFHRWFGDSKAVDEHGRPQVFLHTTRSNFDEFDLDKAKDSAVYGKGIYLSMPDKSWNRMSNDITLHLYLKTKNPLDITKPLDSIDMKRLSEYAGRNVETPPLMTMEKRHGSVINGASVAGYDSIIHVGPGAFGKNVVAFHPHQIKSAIDNSGAFSHPTKITESAYDSIATSYIQMIQTKE